MGHYYNSTRNYLRLMGILSNSTNITSGVEHELKDFSDTIFEKDLEDRYSAPMRVIGVYIAVASLFCILAMVADLLHCLRSRKLWFPCKYFQLNAVTLAGITVAMKLPVDLSGSLPGDVDQVAKLGSMAFMCTMMANFLPCLATMDSNQLLTNVIALVVLVITLVVNIIIQIITGVVGKIPNYRYEALEKLQSDTGFHPKSLKVLADIQYTTVAIIYVTLLLLLLIIHVSSSLVILKSKQIIESKYQTASKKVPGLQRHDVEELQQHVSKYWIMAVSGSPQFISACSATTTAAGVICVSTFIFHFLTLGWTVKGDEEDNYNSAYKRSTLVILIVQSVGVLVGTVAPLFRCFFASISFKLSIKSILNHIKVFKVEKYWTQKLSDWKYVSISLPLLTISVPFGNHKRKMVIGTLKNLILDFVIKLQEGVVVVCKITGLIPFFLTLCLRCFKWLFRAVFSSGGVKIDQNLEQRGQYVLQLENENELTESTLNRLLKSLNRLIQKSERKKPKNLMKLINEKSTKGFRGVKTFDKDDHHVQCSPSSKVEYQDCWSLSVVTLTTIAVTLPNVEKVKVKRLLKSVREGLEYVTLVEEILINATDDDYESIQKAAKTLWKEVDNRDEWLGIKLKVISSQVNTKTDASQADTTLQIVQLFLKKADANIKEARMANPDVDESKFKSICSTSMSRIAETIISDNEHHKINIFDELSSRIADIIAACLTNLPQAIAIKCHKSVIEKREKSVKVAAKLLGETKEIINTLQEYDVPTSMNVADDLPFIHKWRAYLSHP